MLSPPANTTPPSTKPTLPELMRFTCTDGRVMNIPVEIATKYVQFGAFLLDDRNRSRFKMYFCVHNCTSPSNDYAGVPCSNNNQA